MKLRNKKGFTIVELVIVIAVVAILAAVLIPTFANLIARANESADIQAVRQMNTILATHVDGSIKNVFDAVRALDKENIELENYKPLQKDRYFYFYIENGIPKIVYTDGEDNVIFPKEAKIDGVQLMSLSGDVPTDSNYTIAADGAVTIDSGAKLSHLIESKKNASEALTITLSGDVDLKGAAVDFGQTRGNITIKGESGATLSGIRADNNTVSPTTGEYANHSYGFGLLGDVQSGTVTIEDITIEGLNVGNSLATHEEGANTTGLVAGFIQAGAKVVLKNVTFKDCTVLGYQKVGGIVGQLHGTLEMNNVKFENVSVNGVVEVAKVAGRVTGTMTIDQNCDLSGIKTIGLQGDYDGTYTKAEVGQTLPGDGANTFAYWNTTIYGYVTNDYAWYSIGNKSVTVNGKSYTLNGITASTSKNIVNGQPQN